MYPEEAYNLYKLRSICAKLTKAEEGLLKIKHELQQNGLDANNADKFDHQIRTVQSSINGYTPMLDFTPMLVVLSGEEVGVLSAEEVVEAQVVGVLPEIKTHEVSVVEATEVPIAQVMGKKDEGKGAVATVGKACEVHPCEIPKAHLAVPTIPKKTNAIAAALKIVERRKTTIATIEKGTEETKGSEFGPSADL